MNATFLGTLGQKLVSIFLNIMAQHGGQQVERVVGILALLVPPHTASIITRMIMLFSCEADSKY